MARFGWLAVPAALIVAAGIWWSAEALMQPDDPALGPAVVIKPTGTPDPGSSDPGTTDPTEPPATVPGDGASTVPPAPPPHAGDDDDDDTDDDDDDGDDDD